MMKMARRACAAVLLLMLGAAWTSPRAFAQLLPPPGSLVVTMTSPASGSTVAGTVPVSASVSIVGSLVVAGVQFKLDGANLGAEDTSAPYSVSWDTTAASNGSHTLTAVARDLLGLEYASAPVTVTVSNAPPDTPPPQTVKRFEEADPSVTYTAGWSQDTSRSWIGGAPPPSTTPGAQTTSALPPPSLTSSGPAAASSRTAPAALSASPLR